MQQKRKYWAREYWYCLIATENGYRAITSAQGKYLEYEEDKKPLILSEYDAKECATRIIANCRKALSVCLPYELQSQKDLL